MVQLRLKGATTRQWVSLAEAVLAACRREGIPLIINDRVDVCLAVGANGVHLGQDDMPVRIARRLLGPAAVIGATTQTPRLAGAAQAAGASYVAVGPMFRSPTKPEKEPIGPGRAFEVKNAVSVPVCAIGGIGQGNILEVAAAGADLFAVVSAIAEAEAPAEAAQALANALASTGQPD